MTGYHYTSWENWQRIQREGLQPYHIHKTWMHPDYPNGVMGIWTWLEPQYGEAHRGQTLFTMLRHHTNRVAVLSYPFAYGDELRPLDGGEYWLTHTGDLSTPSRDDVTHRPAVVYHVGVPAVVLTAPIPAGEITLLRDAELTL